MPKCKDIKDQVVVLLWIIALSVCVMGANVALISVKMSMGVVACPSSQSPTHHLRASGVDYKIPDLQGKKRQDQKREMGGGR